ncbi:MAG: polysaccharide deacetylase family protein [Candidatus Latescibacteria bacterium]|nr:polysaccharide deacetylase family protein [Candidatus Latescibacterota bacterium]NIM22268.1 polysaccharide deacetylase family protein [Candidatus Latescibacterota bacterium]NIM65747.1 polysaccharide deacetylase family protein [Candidatus Latescibacterota bacterium]NIO02132.1 polysaccharide deacetylase family protein [Candidatus Latescibacterota bacterium]NIO28964.1 polysaccharide deacetylase family protein [Candidatus Latescibacterota bacterium]
MRNLFKFVLKSRGKANLLKRTGQVVARFGASPGRMNKRFDRFMDLLDRHSCRPTFPITALPMSRHPELARMLLSRGAELAVHGYTHVDLTALDKEGQSENIGKAIRLFRHLGVPFAGFRAPYLHWNEDTMSLVESYQFRYSSNLTVLWDVVDLKSLEPSQVTGWEKSREFYRPLEAESAFVIPFRKRGFVEIPVSLPDDETLVDRMYLKDPEHLSVAWEAILERTYDREEIFTLQLHPERVDYFAEPLANLLSSCRAKKQGVWIATLEEIAVWWAAKAQNSAEFVRENGAYRVALKACKGTTVYHRMGGVERALEPGVIKIESPLRPCVGMSPGSNRGAIGLLRDRGYIIEVGEPPEDYAVHVGKIDSSDPSEMRQLVRRLDSFEGPLLRYGTWPYGKRSALSVTGDIDAMTIWDFLHRLRGA